MCNFCLKFNIFLAVKRCRRVQYLLSFPRFPFPMFPSTKFSVLMMCFSQPLRHKQMGKGVHFLFEVVSRLKFSGEHDPAGRFLKKGAQSAFFPGVLPLWGLTLFFSILWPIMVILVCIYMFSGITNRLQ